MAWAMPGYVRLRSRQRSGPGDRRFWPVSVWFAHRGLPSTKRGAMISVGVNLGSPRNESIVALLIRSPVLALVALASADLNATACSR